MEFLLGTAVAAILVTTFAAWRLVARRPDRSVGSQVMAAALSFPALALVLFVVATVVALVGASDAPANQGAGMVVFAFVFFLIYALVIGVVIGIPTAIVAVRSFRRRQV
jgi:hypothetical protein